METQESPVGEGNPFQDEVSVRVSETFGTPVPDAKPTLPSDPYALCDGWANFENYKKPFDYITMRGQRCLIKRLDMQDLLEMGIANEMDFMTKALMSEESSKADTAQDAVTSAVMRAKNMPGVSKMINAVVLQGVIKPEILPAPKNEDQRQQGKLYVDKIPFEDRMELFGQIFETGGLSTFRQEPQLGVGDMETVASVSLPAE